MNERITGMTYTIIVALVIMAILYLAVNGYIGEFINPTIKPV